MPEMARVPEAPRTANVRAPAGSRSRCGGGGAAFWPVAVRFRYTRSRLHASSRSHSFHGQNLGQHILHIRARCS